MEYWYILGFIAVVVLFFVVKHYVWDKPRDEIVRLNHELAQQREDFRKELVKLKNEYEEELNKVSREKEHFFHDKEKAITSLESIIRDREALIAKYSYLEAMELELKTAKTKVAELEKYEQVLIQRMAWYIEQKCNSYPHLAGLKADLITRHYEYSAKILTNKQRPALEEAKRIRELKKETEEIIKQKNILEYKLAYIRALHPNIDDYFDSGFSVFSDAELETEETTDRVRLYLDHDQYTSLTITERNQLALDNYIAGQKSKWQIGRDYELFIGHLCEKQGYRVEYTGIFMRLEDMGRDLVVSDGKETYIIQCKNWSQEKELHENHVFQLYGSLIMYRIENPFFPVHAVLVTTTKLSSLAEQIAQTLDIAVRYVKMGEFPRIKCNIGKDSNGSPTKIYHLPFDQQYDKAQIVNEGECYATTVAEAENKGFRRAYKWTGK